MPWSNQAVTLIVLEESATGFTGLFAYSPVPGHGNLVASIAAAAGTDPFGNPYQAGITAYGTPPVPGGSQPDVQVVTGTGTARIRFLTGGATEGPTKANLLTEVFNPGAANEQLALFIGGPTESGSADSVSANLFSSPDNGNNAALGQLVWTPAPGGASARLNWGQLGLSRNSIGGINGGVPLYKSDVFTRSATGAGITPLTVAWPIPANDTVAGLEGTSYIIECGGLGTWPNPGVAGIPILTVFGQNFPPSPITFSAAFLTAGHSFSWNARIRIKITTVGATGSALIDGWIAFTDNAGISAGHWELNNDIDGIAPATIDTTSATTMDFGWKWNAAPANGGFTCYHSDFIRLEP